MSTRATKNNRSATKSINVHIDSALHDKLKLLAKRDMRTIKAFTALALAKVIREAKVSHD